MPTQPPPLPNAADLTSGRLKVASIQRSWWSAAGEDLLKWSWLLAVTGSFLSVGLAGFGAGLGPGANLVYFVPGKSDLDSAADSALMTDLISEAPPTEAVTAETVEVIQEVPPAVDVTQPPLDLPELAEALVTEDLFTIPTAPKIEEALKPIDPALPKPVVRRVTTAAPSTTPRRSTANSTPGTGGGVGSGGTGGGGSGNGKFVIPRPSYPNSLKSMGIQGTVRLKIVVGVSGRPSSVSVIGTSGNSSLDQYAAGWVRRNGKAPPGDVRTVIAPLSFVLN
jgi:periplasmic protein TonB